MTRTHTPLRPLAALGSVVLFVVSSVGCSAGSTPTGTLIGGIVEVRGSSAGAHSSYQTGIVTVQGPSGIVARADLAVPGKAFRFHLKQGFYLLRALKVGLPADACKASASILQGRTTHEDIICTLLS